MSATTAEDRLRIALELAEVGEQMVRMRLRREHPEWDDEHLRLAMEGWMRHRPGAPIADHPGPRSTRVLGDATR